MTGGCLVVPPTCYTSECLGSRSVLREAECYECRHNPTHSRPTCSLSIPANRAPFASGQEHSYLLYIKMSGVQIMEDGSRMLWTPP